MIVNFYKEFGPLGYLANYSNHGFEKNGIYYKTVEHYYQSEKFANEEIKLKIINCKTPKEASTIGRDRNNIRKDNFKNIKNNVMYEGVLEKFRQNVDIRCKLIETGNAKIVENTVDEYYWGAGKDNSGKNHMGKILEQVRETIKNEVLDKILKESSKGKVYILGHPNPDADSVFSSYLLSKILKSMNINSDFCVLEKDYEYCQNDKKLIIDYLPENPKVIKNIGCKKFILVDHNNLYALKKNNIIGAFDHHVITGEIDNLIEIEYASTALLIYNTFKNKYLFSEEEKRMIFLSVLADTEYLCSSRFKEEDKTLLDQLDIKMDVRELQKKYFTITNFNNGFKDNLKYNYKEYKYADKVIKRSLIYSYQEEYDKYYDLYLKEVKKYRNYLLIWCDFENQRTYIYINDKKLALDYILTSTYLILNMIEKA